MSPQDELQNRGSTFFGEAKRNQFYVQSVKGEPIDTRDLYKAAKVIGKYRDLNRSEAEILETFAMKRFNFMIALEYEALRPKYEAKAQQIEQRQLQKKKSLAQSSGRISPQQATVHMEKVELETKNLMASLQVDWKAEAQNLARTKLGASEFALAVKAEKEKSLVGIAHIVADGVKISKSLLELEKPLLVLDERPIISLDGKVITVLQAEPVDLSNVESD